MAEITYPSAESVRSEEISQETRLHLAHAIGSLLQQLPATASIENADLADAVGAVLAFLPAAMRAHAVARASFEVGDSAWQQLTAAHQRSWRLRHRESLLQQLADDLKHRDRIDCVEVQWMLGADVLVTTSVPQALDYLANDIHWHADAEWSDADALRLCTI